MSGIDEEDRYVPRVHELAKELGVQSKTILAQLKDMGTFVRSASSVLDEPTARRVRAAFTDSVVGYLLAAQETGQPPADPRESAALEVLDTILSIHMEIAKFEVRGETPAGSPHADRLGSRRPDQSAERESAALNGNFDAAVALALVAVENGELDSAERHCREPAEAGHRAAAYLLGGLLAGADTDIGENSRRWWRRAISNLDTEQAHQLGSALQWNPQIVHHEQRLRMIAESGSQRATYVLGRLLANRGDEDQAHAVFMDAQARAMDAKDLLTVAYTAIRLSSQQQRTLGGNSDEAANLAVRPLTPLAEGGDSEARYLVGLHAEARARYRRDGAGHEIAERHYKIAAEAEHSEAMVALARLRLHTRDRGGAMFWWRRAAEAGHAGAGRELATRERATDVRLHWARFIAQVGHPAAAWCVAELQRSQSTGSAPVGARSHAGHGPSSSTVARAGTPVALTAGDGDLPSDAVAEVIGGWDELHRLAPDPARSIEFLSQRTGLPRGAVAQVRRVRNQCAHPARQGWPDSYDLEIALATVKELRRRLVSGN